MELTEIRGVSAEDDLFFCPTRSDRFPDLPGQTALCRADGDLLLCGRHGYPDSPLCRITLHAIGARGERGLCPEFARFCRKYAVDPRFLSASDMGISFFVPKGEKERVLDALCAYFKIWE